MAPAADRGDRRIRVFIVDDHDLIRAGLRATLAADHDIVGEAATVADAIPGILEAGPDVVLVDVSLEEAGHGAAVVSGVLEAGGDPAFLALSALSDRHEVMAMIRAGARGYMTKGDSPRLPRAIEMVAAGIPYFSRQLAAMVKAVPHIWDQLDPEEHLVMNRVIGGLDLGEVADELGRSEAEIHGVLRRVLQRAREQGG